MVQKLEVRDPRWDLAWCFGDILRDIPRRLGGNAALDAACATVVETMPCLTSRSYSAQMIKAYAHGLRTLQRTLSDLHQSTSTESWVAIYLMWICQVHLTLESIEFAASLTCRRAGLVFRMTRCWTTLKDCFICGLSRHPRLSVRWAVISVMSFVRCSCL